MSSSTSSSAKLQLMKAKEELDAGDADAALALCKKVLAADRSNYNAYILVGVACARKADLPRAVQAYDRAIALKPAAPVAHKGLIDALRGVADTAPDAALPLRRARAHAALAPLSPAHARGARAAAAETLYTLAARDAELVPEAIAAWRALREDVRGEGGEAGELPHGATRVESVVAVLAAIGAGCCRVEEELTGADPAGPIEGSGSVRDPSLFEGGDLGDALDYLEGLEAPLGPHETDARAQELVVFRICARVRSGKLLLERAGHLLRALKEDEAYLALVEEDSSLLPPTGTGQLYVQFPDLLDRASSVLESDVRPREAPRATAIKAASMLYASASPSLQVAADLIDASSEHTRAAAAKRLRASGKLGGPGSTNPATSIAASLSTPTECLVRGRIHLMAGENKQCIAATQRGLALCTALGRRDRMKTVLRLLKAHALMADRQYGIADTELSQAFAWATEMSEGAVHESTLFMQRAVVRGRIRSAEMKSFPDQHSFMSSLQDILTVAAKSKCPEMVAIAKVEKLWTDALEGSVALEEMEALVTELNSLEESQRGSQESSSSASSLQSWEMTVLGDVLVGTLRGTVALATMRLAQMILLKSEGSDSSLLQRAQDLLMQSAGFMGSRPGPFALLGWIFEMKAFSEGTAVEVRTKLSARAMRCYRKSCNIDPAHILASRRLCRLLTGVAVDSSEDSDELSKVAEAVTEKNSRSRWAWNVLGWVRLERGLVPEAALAFQNSLKGESSNTRSTLSACFGTEPGANTPSARDIDSLVDADSWRGLSCAYKLQGKLASAASCLDAAIDLLTAPVSSGPSQSRDSHEANAVFEVEKADLLTSLEKSSEAIELLHMNLLPAGSALASVDHLTTVQLAGALSAARAYLAQADERWSEGWFHKATALRRQAAAHLGACIDKGLASVPGVSPSIVYKLLGEALYAAASARPRKLAAILPQAEIARDLAASRTAYEHAIDHDGESDVSALGRIDLAMNLAKQAELKQDSGLAREAIQLITNASHCSSSNSSQLAKALHILGDIEDSHEFRDAARHLLIHAFQQERSDCKRLESALDIVEMSVARRDAEMASKYALSALRIDATDWKAWFATGLARETDGNVAGWTAKKMQSTIDAYSEAERLGGGGPIVAEKISGSLERQVASLVQSRSAGAADAKSIAEIGNLAAASLAAAARSGASPSEMCRAATREAARDYVERVLAREDMSRDEKLHEIPYHADRIKEGIE